MTKERWIQLNKNPELQLTEEEIEEGWHFCYNWDGLLVGPEMEEMDCCTCFKKL
jgi:hypothetical protein